LYFDKHYSKKKFLFQINKEDYKIMKKIELNDFEFFDALYLNNKIILSSINLYGNKMGIIEFN
jgi:hypothetical protein